MPYRICDIDINDPLPALVLRPDETGFALIVRQGGRPTGFILHAASPTTILQPEALGRLIELHIQQAQPGAPPLAIAPERLMAAKARSLTVAICTHQHPEDLERCLDRLSTLRGNGERFELLVIDNAPSDDRTRTVVERRQDVRYIRESRPGLDFARNRALREATTDLIAFVDDDVIVDQLWLLGLRQALAQHPDAAAVTGLVFPAELATDAQVLFERRGGFQKHFTTTCFSSSLYNHPFYPCLGGKFGTGCNMALVRSIALELGGFDEALDAGAALPGGGDADMFYRIVRAGYPLVYEPQFVVFHRHRREYAQLRRQYCRSWGQGLMAHIAKTYRYDVPQRRKLRALTRWWFGDQLRSLVKSLAGRHVLPPDLVAAELWGGVVGLLRAYPRSVRRAEEIRRRFA
jgi:GT2 family glycosyltransferase